MCFCVCWPAACSFLLQIYSSFNWSPQGHVLVVLHTHTHTHKGTHTLLLWPGQTTNNMFNAEQKQLTGCGLFLHHSLFIPLSIYLATAYCFSSRPILEILHQSGDTWKQIYLSSSWCSTLEMVIWVVAIIAVGIHFTHSFQISQTGSIKRLKDLNKWN